MASDDPRFGVYAALCQFQVKCAPRVAFTGSLAASSTECLIAVLERENAGFSVLSGLDFAASRACIEQATDSCDPMIVDDLFTCLIESDSRSPENGCCDGITDCAAGFFCDRDRRQPTGTCQPLPAVAGEVCVNRPRRSLPACAANLECSIEGACLASSEVGGENQPCSTRPARCAPGLQCTDNRCRVILDEGDPCTISLDLCGPGLRCGETGGGTNGECVVAPRLGDACQAAGSPDICAEGSCIDDICQQRTRLVGEVCNDAFSCIGDSTCDDTSAACSIQQTMPGDACSDVPCVPPSEQICVFDAGNRACAARIPDGMPCDPGQCWLGSECDSGTCAPRVTGLCQ